MNGHQSTSDRPVPIGRLVGAALLIRILIDTSVQIFFPFLPVIAAGLKVSEVKLGQLLSLRALMGLGAPIFGATADRYSYRPVLAILLVLSALGMLVIGWSQSLLIFGLGMTLTGIGLMAFPPTLAAYLSAQLSFERRSRGLGIIEYAWGLAGIVGLSLIGRLIDWTSWRIPFFVLAGGLICAAAYIVLFLPAAPNRDFQGENPAHKKRETLRTFFDLGANWRSAVSVMAAGIFIRLGSTLFFINYGTWFTQDYGLSATQLGTVALFLGIADFVGSGLVSLFGDSIGKRRSLMLGCGVAAFNFFLLPFLNINYFFAVVGAFVARAANEFSIVSNIVLVSEQVPAQRGKVMTLDASVVRASTAVAVLFAPILFAKFQVAGIGYMAAAAYISALVITFLFAKESG